MRIGGIGYCSEQGLGHLARWFYGWGLVQEMLLIEHPRHPAQKHWYPPETPFVSPRDISGPAVHDFLKRIDVLFCWETFFDWSIVSRCREYGVKSVIMPMIEWSPKQWPVKPDACLCPSLLDYDEFRGEFPPGLCEFIPVPTPPDVKWSRRDKALRFLHNAGHVGHREHKGTRQLLEALRFVKSPLDLTVRCQYEGMLWQMAEGALLRSEWAQTSCDTWDYGGAHLRIESGSLPYDRLWDGYDVYVAPEKLNGLSLPLQEAFCAGLLVMTTDRYPANTWLPNAPLIPAAKRERVCISRNYREVEECTIAPEAIAAKLDEWYGKDIRPWSEAGQVHGAENSWTCLEPKYRTFMEAVCRG